MAAVFDFAIGRPPESSIGPGKVTTLEASGLHVRAAQAQPADGRFSQSAGCYLGFAARKLRPQTRLGIKDKAIPGERQRGNCCKGSKQVKNTRS
jgi:hypothetical protein